MLQRTGNPRRHRMMGERPIEHAGMLPEHRAQGLWQRRETMHRRQPRPQDALHAMPMMQISKQPIDIAQPGTGRLQGSHIIHTQRNHREIEARRN